MREDTMALIFLYFLEEREDQSTRFKKDLELTNQVYSDYLDPTGPTNPLVQFFLQSGSVIHCVTLHDLPNWTTWKYFDEKNTLFMALIG